MKARMSCCGGFTLLELLVALLIVLMVAALADGLLRSQQSAFQLTHANVELLDRQRDVAGYVSRWLERSLAPPQVIDSSLLPAPWTDDAVGSVLVFQAITPDSAGLPRTRTHSFWIAYGDDEHWRPSFVKADPPCFRLMHRIDSEVPVTSHDDWDDSAPWLARHLRDSTAPVVPVAEHVIGLMIRQGADKGVTMMLTDAAGWRRCEPAQASGLAADLRALTATVEGEGRLIDKCREVGLELRLVRLNWPRRWDGAVRE